MTKWKERSVAEYKSLIAPVKAVRSEVLGKITWQRVRLWDHCDYLDKKYSSRPANLGWAYVATKSELMLNRKYLEAVKI